MPDSAEDLEQQITKLKDDLAVSEQNVIDFERIAHEWKKSYLEMEIKHKVKIKNLEQTIEELKKEKL